MFTITVKTNSQELSATFQEEVLLSSALEQMGIFQDKPCGGNGTCKKCLVNANGKAVLSCQTYVGDDTYVEYTTSKNKIQGLTKGFIPHFEKKPLLDHGYGMAVDIGTTTVAGYIYAFPECECVKCVAAPNPQATYGADVIARIEHAGKGGLLQLQKAICDCIVSLADGYPIERYVITGNTSMLHLLTGKDPAGIAVAPYTPKSLFGKWYGKAYLPRCISAYVGADITTAILSSGMREKETSLLVDIGTNGEMVLWHNNVLTCCSTAAGPAFEGAGISHGTHAISGAINQVFIEDGTLKYTTIDNQPPIGICGTGLIDAIACMLRLGVIDKTGYMEQDYEIGDSHIFITTEDVRQVQLAKSAIRSGIDTLVHSCGIDLNDIDALYLAGGFGSFIHTEHAAILKLIPGELVSKTVVTGNSAGIGAAMILQSEVCLSEAEQIAAMAETVELSYSSYFMQKYIENMMF